MFRAASLLTVAFAVTFVSQVEAAPGQGFGNWSPQPKVQAWTPNQIRIGVGTPQVRWRPPVTNPVITPSPVITPPRKYYFGVTLQITHTAYGRGLQVASVTPNSPAALAGLEQGDVLLMANSVSLQNAFSNEHGVQLLNAAVGGGAPAPAVAATTTVGFNQPASPSVLLTVINARTGQPIHVTVRPYPTGGGAPAPAVASPAFAH